MLPNNPNNQLGEEFYFVNESDKFFSFQLIQTPSLSISMIEGTFEDGKEDATITQLTTKKMASMTEAITFIVQLVHQKTLEGYILLDAPTRSQNKELSIKKENSSEQPLEISFTPSEEPLSACDVPSKSPSSQSENLLISRSEGKAVSDDYELIEESKDKHSETEKGIIEVCVQSSSDPLVEKTFKITDFQQKDIELAISKATEYDLESQLTSNSIQVVGKQSSLFEFLNWLYDHLNVLIISQKQSICTKKISISTFHRVNRGDILKKAEELNIECDFRYYMMLITGSCQNIDKFKNYLEKVEKATKKALYPKYWDLKDTNPPKPAQVHKLNFTQNNTSTSTNTNMNYLPPPPLQIQPANPSSTTKPDNSNLILQIVESLREKCTSSYLLGASKNIKKHIYNNNLNVSALSRIKKDVIEIQADTGLDFIFVEDPDEKNLSKRILHLIGPSYSPYEGGLFKIQITFPDDYPLNPPLVNFQTKIYHPCIDNEGNICLGLLDQWRPTGSLKQIALLISAMLYDPSLEEHIMPGISSQYHTHRQSFVSQACSWTQKYAE